MMNDPPKNTQTNENLLQVFVGNWETLDNQFLEYVGVELKGFQNFVFKKSKAYINPWKPPKEHHFLSNPERSCLFDALFIGILREKHTFNKLKIKG